MNKYECYLFKKAEDLRLWKDILMMHRGWAGIDEAIENPDMFPYISSTRVQRLAELYQWRADGNRFIVFYGSPYGTDLYLCGTHNPPSMAHHTHILKLWKLFNSITNRG